MCVRACVRACWSIVVEYPLEHCSSLYVHGRSIQCRLTREDAIATMYILMLRLLCGPLGGPESVFQGFEYLPVFFVSNNIPPSILPPSSCLIIVTVREIFEVPWTLQYRVYSHYTHVYTYMFLNER